MNANLKFYDDIKNLIIPVSYVHFANSLCEMLGISNDMLNSLQIFYLDKEGDKIIIENASDYTQFLQQLKNKEVNTIEIELRDENNNITEEANKNFVDYKENEDISKNEEKTKNQDIGNNVMDEIINNNIDKLLKDNNNNDINNNKNDEYDNDFNNNFKFEQQQNNQSKKEIPENLIYQPKK